MSRVDVATRTAPAAPAPGPASALRIALALGVVYVVWGSTYLGIKIAIETVPPMFMAGTRFLLAGAALLAVAWLRGQPLPTAPQWRAAAVVGALMLVGGNGAVTIAEQRLDSGVAALLVATVPLWMALLARVVYGERLRPIAVAGLVLGFGGVAILVAPSSDAATGIDTAASLLVIAGAASWAYGSLRSRTAALPAAPLVSSAAQMLTGGALFVALGAVRGEVAALDLAAVSGRSAAAVLYLAAFGSVLAFSCYAWLLRNAAASTVSTYAYVNPVVAVLLGAVVLGEAVTARSLLAGGVIVAAVALIVAARTRPPAPRA